MQTDADVFIAGGGLVGSTLALALARAGLRIVLAEPRSRKDLAADGFDGRSYALAPASRNLLDALGIWKDIDEHHQPILEIKVSDGRAGEGASPLHVHFGRDELEDGPLGCMVEDRHVRRALMSRLDQDERIALLPESALTGYRSLPGAVEVSVSGDRKFHARLVAGCDGRRSLVARGAGISRVGREYAQASLVCSVAHERPHGGIAHQFFTPSGPLAVLPLPGDRCSIVWTEDRERASAIQAMDDSGYLECLRPVFGRFLGNISLAGDRFVYPLELSVAERFAAERVVLAGDAAHVIHPLAGQGLNVGLRDVAALAEVLERAARRGEDIGMETTLLRYQEWRRFDACLFGAATDGLNRLFSNDDPVLRAARRIGLGLANGIPALKREMVRRAAGFGGVVPPLMRGAAA